MKHRRPSRDNRGGAACILATYAVAAGALAVVYAAVNPLPATQIRDLVSPPAASASVPTRPLSVLPGMGAGLELVRIPRGLDVHTVAWSAGAAHRPVHLNFEGGDSVGRHRVDGSGDFHGHPSDSGRHHRHDQHVGEHHQGSHSHGGHHAEHGGEHRG